MQTSIIGGPVLHKQEVIDRLSVEVQDCKGRRQSTVWAFWHYGMHQLQFADTNAQFRMIKNMWSMQGFKFTQRRDYPELAKQIGARSVVAHVWQNANRTEFNSESMTEGLSMMMGYMNASNEVVTWEINI